MAREYSILISARETFSSAITTMRSANNAFNKDLEGTQSKLDALNKTKVLLDVDTKDAKKSLDKLKREYEEARKSGNGIVSDEMLQKLEEANDYYENSARNLRLVSANAKDAEKQILNMTGAVSKAQTRAGSKSGLIDTLGAAGAIKMGGDLLAGIAGTWVGSALGAEGSSMFSSLLSSAGSGAAVGTALGGAGIGTAVGALAGLGLGVVSGETQIFQKQDEAFKGVVQDQNNTISQKRAADLAAGIELAGQQEIDQIAFGTILNGSEIAREYLAWVKDTARTTPFGYEDLKSMSRTLATYGYDPEEMQTVLMQVGDAGAALNMTAQDMEAVAESLGRMRRTGKTTMRYLDPLIGRGIDVYEYLGDALGFSDEQVTEAIGKGMIPGAEAAKIIADAMGRENENAMGLQSQTFFGQRSALEDNRNELQKAMGDAYDAFMTPVYEEYNEKLEGEFGDQLAEGNRLIGEWHAQLDADRIKELVKAQTDAMESEEYIQAVAEGNGAKAGEILALAEAEAEVAFKESKGYQLYEQTELSLVGRLRDTLAPSWEHFGYTMGQEFTRGLAAARSSVLEKEIGSDIAAFESGQLSWEKFKFYNPHADRATYQSYLNDYGESAYAYGMRLVPYDNFPARLHEGEWVLTAAEAREYQGSRRVQVSVTGNEFIIREEADIDKVAAVLAQKVAEAQMIS